MVIAQRYLRPQKISSLDRFEPGLRRSSVLSYYLLMPQPHEYPEEQPKLHINHQPIKKSWISLPDRKYRHHKKTQADLTLVPQTVMLLPPPF